jgi:hypothetical protein
MLAHRLRRPPAGSCWIPVLLSLALALSSGTAFAQQREGGRAVAGASWVTEAGYAYSVTGGCSDHYPSFEAGPLLHVSSSFAAGVAGFLGHNEDLVYGPRPRVRYGASSDVALDLAGGIVWGGYRSRPNALAAFNYRDVVSAFAHYERYRDGGCGQPFENQLFLGVKVGSRPGIVTALVGSAVAAVVIWLVTRDIEN